MTDLRLYRRSFLPAALALVVLMFSLEGAPEPLEPVTPPTTFDGDRATAIARQIATRTPDRPPGSAGDSAVADLVAERFGEIPAGAVAEQRYEASVDGEEVSMRNVLLTLPGNSAQTIAIVAARDSSDAPAAASSAAATGVLVELANALRVSHAKTFVLASVSGSTGGGGGGAGVRALLDNLPERDAIEAVIVISQPGSGLRVPPYVVTSSTDTATGSVQLERTAERAVEVQAAAPSPEADALTQLARLAIPSGIGDQAPLIADGVDAVGISSAGERPLATGDDQLDDLDPQTVDGFGRAVQSTVAALDVAVADPAHGPATHLELGDNLVPGWALALLALTLILPALIASVDALARASRGGLPLGAALAWAAAGGLPFLGALGALYALALVGAVPRPDFPFDPGLYDLGTRAVIAIAVMAAIAAFSAWLLRARGLTAAKAPEPAAASAGAIASVAATALWLSNPYLALLAAPAAHVWLLAEPTPGLARRLGAIAICALACVPVLAAAIAVAAALDLGAAAPWTFVLMVADGQIGLATALALSFLGGALTAACALALRRGVPAPGAAGGPPPAATGVDDPGPRTSV